MLDGIRAALQLRKLVKTLAGIERQLTRIAEAAERLSPTPMTPDHPLDIDVEDRNDRAMTEYETVRTMLHQRLGRAPTDEEIIAEHEQLEHLLH